MKSILLIGLFQILSSFSYASVLDIKVVPYDQLYPAMQDDCQSNSDVHCNDVAHVYGQGSAASCMSAGSLNYREVASSYQGTYIYGYDFTNRCGQTVKTKLMAGNDWSQTFNFPAGSHGVILVAYNTLMEIPTLVNFELSSGGGNQNPTPAPNPQPTPSPTPPVVNTPNQTSFPGMCKPGMGNPNLPGNSVVNALNRSLSEEIPLPGLPFTLAYSSDRIRAGSTFNVKSLGLGGWYPSIIKFADFQNARIYEGSNGARIFDTYWEVPYGREVATPDGSSYDTFDTNGIWQTTSTAFGGNFAYHGYYNSDGTLSSLQKDSTSVASFSKIADGVEMTLVGGRKVTLVIDKSGNLTSVVNPMGETYRMTYDSRGLLTSFQLPGGQTSHITYDEKGFMVRDRGAGGNYVDLAVTNEGTIATSAMGRKSTYLLTNQNGLRQVVMTSEVGSTSRSSSNQSGQGYVNNYGAVLEASVDKNPVFGSNAPMETYSRYSVPGTPINITKQTSMTAQVVGSSAYRYYGKVDLNTVLQGNRKYHTIYMNELGFTMTSPVGRNSWYTLRQDSGLPQSYSTSVDWIFYYDYDGNQKPIKFSFSDNKTHKQNVLESYEYDKFNNVSAITNALGQKTNYEYDLASRVTGITLPDQSKIAMTYDLNGSLISITPPSKSPHSFGYNAFNMVGKYLPPSVSAKLSGATIYDYNLDKQITSITRPDGAKIGFNYDQASGLLTSLDAPNGKYNLSYKDKTDLVSQIQTPDGQTISYQYAANYPLQVTSTGDVPSTIAITYNSDATVGSYSVADASGRPTVVGYSYDLDGLVTGAGNIKYSIDKTGRLTNSTFGKISNTKAYAPIGYMTSDVYSNGKATIASYTPSLDAAGRVLSKAEVYGSTKVTSQYSYDLQGRLTKAVSGGVTRSYTYDANGNRLTFTNGTKSYTGVYDEQDRLVSYGNSNFTYNDNGDLLTRTDVNPDTKEEKVTSFTYDVFGNLRQVKLADGRVIDYVIDGLNRRVGKKINGKLVQGFIYLNQLQIAAEVDGSGHITKTFVYGTKVNVPDYVNFNGKQYRIISDQVGTPKMIVDSATGVVAEQLSVDEFGQSLDGKVSAIIPFGFAGGLYDADTGLVRFGARDYSPVVGRWTNKDPMGFGGGQSNLYVYVGNNPINLIDPSGKFGIFAVAGAFAGVGATLNLFGYVTTTPYQQMTLRGIGTAAAIGATAGLIPLLGTLGSLPLAAEFWTIMNAPIAGTSVLTALAGTAVDLGLNSLMLPTAIPSGVSNQEVAKPLTPANNCNQ